MTRTVALTCDNCGAPLDVPEQVRFVTCDHCNARLRIERTDGAVFTKILETVARVEKQSSATAAAVRVIELEREIERIDADLAKLIDPGGWGVVWLLGALVCLSGFVALTAGADTEACAYGILGIPFFGVLAGWLAIGRPRQRREYAAARAQLAAKRAEFAEQLAAARSDEARTTAVPTPPKTKPPGV